MQAPEPNSLAFQKLKLICVPLLYSAPDAPPLPPSLQGTVTLPSSIESQRQLFSDLARTLSAIDPPEFTLLLANYVYVPLSKYLHVNHLSERLLEGVFEALKELVVRWIQCPSGMDDTIFEQFFILGVLKLGGAIDFARSAEQKKGKERELAEETKLTIVQFLRGMMTGLQRNKLPEIRKAMRYQLINVVLDLVRFAQALELRFASLELLSAFLTMDNSFLLSILAGLISTLASATLNVPSLSVDTNEGMDSKTMRSFNSDFSCRCLQVLGDILRALQPFDGTGEAERTKWTHPLSLTLEHVVSSLRASERPKMREALAAFAPSLLPPSSNFLAVFPPSSTELNTTKNMLITAILLLATDDFPEVASKATSYCVDHLSLTSGMKQIVRDIISESLDRLPPSLYRRDTVAVQEAAKIIEAGCRLNLISLQLDDEGEEGVRQIAKQEKWIWGILRGLENPRMTQTKNVVEYRPQNQTDLNLLRLENCSVPLVAEETEIESAVERMLFTIASSSTSARIVHGLTAREITDKFWAISNLEFENAKQKVARGEGKEEEALDEMRITSRALWVVGKLASGVGQKEKKRLKKWIPSIVDMINQRDGLTEDEELHVGTAAVVGDIGKQITAEELEETRVEWNGYQAAGVLHTQRPPSDASSLVLSGKRPTDRQIRKMLIHEGDRLICNGLSALVAISSALGDAFRPELMTTLYPVLRLQASVSSSSLVASNAQTSLDLIARNVGYSSTADLLRDNCDYLIEAVSARLSPSFGAAGMRGMDIDAPLVLVAMLRRVGTSSTVELMRDVVDDALDLLDDYHSYDAISARLWLFLDTVVQVVKKDDTPHPPKLIKTEEDTVRGENEELLKFHAWVDVRRIGHQPAEDITPPESPRVTSITASSFKQLHPENEELVAGEHLEPQATKVQHVLISILNRTPYFLSHFSPTLRARLLALLASLVSLLSSPTTEKELLPLIHRCWPYIVKRISPKEEPFVILEAVSLIQELAKWTGDFVGQRIVDDVWPNIKKILQENEKEQGRRDLIRREKYAVRSKWDVAVLKMALQVVKSTRTTEETRWDITLLLRSLLDERQDEATQQAAVDLYVELFNRNPSGTWLALEGAGCDTGLPRFLRLPAHLDITANCNRIY